MALHALEQKTAFGDETIAVAEKLKSVYGMDLTAADSHRLCEAEAQRSDQ